MGSLVKSLKSLLSALIVVLGVLALACSSPSNEPVPTSQRAPTPTEAADETPDPDSPTDVRAAIGTIDLAVGPSRFVFALIDQTSQPIRIPLVEATFLFLDATPVVTAAQQNVSFVGWPVGRSGAYVANLTFDQPGRWGLVVSAVDEQGNAFRAQQGFIVRPQSSSVGLGKAAPRSLNKTAGRVEDLAAITTDPSQDPDLYQITLADAIDSGRPTIVTFATPAFCQSATCGPQVDMVSNVKERHKDQANFIHVEVFDNPLEMDGDINKGRLSPLLEVWGLQIEPFTFVIDGQGLVASKFEGFVTEEELEEALVAVLEG